SGPESTALRLGGDEFLEEEGLFRKFRCALAGQHGLELVAKGQKAGRLEPHDGCVISRMRLKGIERALHLRPRLFHKARAQEGAPGAEGPRRLHRGGMMNAVAGRG